MDRLLQRIERRLAERGLTERQACRNASLTADAIRNIRRGRAPRAATLVALARALGCPAEHLLDASHDHAGAAAPPAPLPLRSTPACHGLTMQLRPAGTRLPAAPPAIDLLTAPAAFAASVPGGAPPPFRPGDLVVCDPALPVAAGDACLAERLDGTYEVGILLGTDQAAAELQLAGGAKKIPLRGLRRLYRVVEIRLR